MNDPVVGQVFQMILALNAMQLKELRDRLGDIGGDPAGVGAALPPDKPLRESGVEAPLSEWPADYWESQT